jgi:hypothetical protein
MNIVYLFSREFCHSYFGALVIAVPIAWYYEPWLQDYPTAFKSVGGCLLRADYLGFRRTGSG